MTVSDIINGILDREKQGTPPYLVPNDKGGRTSWGISERSHPEAWENGPPSRDAAFLIYLTVYFEPFRMLWAAGLDTRVIAVLVDDAVMRGVSDAKKRFQAVLGLLPPDGIIGPVTIKAALMQAPVVLLKRYVVERAIRISRVVEHDHTQAEFIVGWMTRILKFLP